MKYLGAASLAILVLALVGCTGHQGRVSHHPRVADTGTVTGVVGKCGPPGARGRPVVVAARRDGRTIAIQVMHPPEKRYRYRLRLAPGRYQISARGSGDSALVVVVHAGRTVTANFPPVCD